MKMTNENIYTTASKLQEVFTDEEQKFPVKINFYLQKNKKLLMELAAELEQDRWNIIQQYGVLNEDQTAYDIPADDVKKAEQDLRDLFALEQDVNIYMVNIDTFPEDMHLTSAQMEALMFMIEDK